MKSFIEKNKDRKSLEEILPANMPLGLSIEPTNRCNYKCIQCAVSLPEFKDEIGPLGHMEVNLYQKIIKDVNDMGTLKNLNLYGDGEPFLNQHIVDMVRIAKTASVANAITITTNGYLINESVAKEIVKSRLDYLRVSIYSIFADRFKQITQTKLNSEIVLENIKRLRKIRDAAGTKYPFIYVKMIDTYSNENKEFMETYYPYADEVNIETPMNWNGYKGIDLISRIDPERKTNEELIQGYHSGVEKCRSGYKKICTTPFLALNIKMNGDVVICIVDWNKGTKVGNIREESLSQIWFGKRLREFREMHIKQKRQENPSCCNCSFLYSSPDNMDHFSEEKYHEILNAKMK